MVVWDDETSHLLASRHVKLARDAGALSEFPLAVRSRILVHSHGGELEEGAALIAEAQAAASMTGSQLSPCGATGIAAWRGGEAEATEHIQVASFPGSIGPDADDPGIAPPSAASREERRVRHRVDRRRVDEGSRQACGRKSFGSDRT